MSCSRHRRRSSSLAPSNSCIPVIRSSPKSRPSGAGSFVGSVGVLALSWSISAHPTASPVPLGSICSGFLTREHRDPRTAPSVESTAGYGGDTSPSRRGYPGRGLFRDCGDRVCGCPGQGRYSPRHAADRAERRRDAGEAGVEVNVRQTYGFSVRMVRLRPERSRGGVPQPLDLPRSRVTRVAPIDPTGTPPSLSIPTRFRQPRLMAAGSTRCLGTLSPC
jgi:hypothetical protein